MSRQWLPQILVLKIEDMRDGIPKSDKSDGTGTVDEAGKGDSEPEFSLWAAVEALATTASGSYSGFAGGDADIDDASDAVLDGSVGRDVEEHAVDV